MSPETSCDPATFPGTEKLWLPKHWSPADRHPTVSSRRHPDRFPQFRKRYARSRDREGGPWWGFPLVSASDEHIRPANAPWVRRATLLRVQPVSASFRQFAPITEGPPFPKDSKFPPFRPFRRSCARRSCAPGHWPAWRMRSPAESGIAARSSSTTSISAAPPVWPALIRSGMCAARTTQDGCRADRIPWW